MEQLSLFELFPNACVKRWPGSIEELSKDIKNAIKGEEFEEEYSVWAHVPNLGKRYCVFIRNVYSEDFKALEQIVNKYKERKLDVSVNVIPNMMDGPLDFEHNDYMISTLWKTKGHIEIL